MFNVSGKIQKPSHQIQYWIYQNYIVFGSDSPILPFTFSIHLLRSSICKLSLEGRLIWILQAVRLRLDYPKVVDTDSTTRLLVQTIPGFGPSTAPLWPWPPATRCSDSQWMYWAYSINQSFPVAFSHILSFDLLLLLSPFRIQI